MRHLKRLFLAYLVVIAVFAFLQRTLMYPALREERIVATGNADLVSQFSILGNIEIVAGGEKIGGWHLQVNKKPSDRLVIFFHGNGGHRGRRSEWYELLRSMNVDVLTIDYRGYGDSEGKPSEKALTEDAEATWKYAVEVLGFKPNQIVILGESLGGGVSVKLTESVCNRDERPAGLILVATFSSMLETASKHYWWLPVRFLLLDRYRSDLAIAKVTCPILQFHGNVDRIVPYSLGKKLHDLAPATSSNGTHKSFITLEGTDHNDVLDRNGDQVRDAIRDWLQLGR